MMKKTKKRWLIATGGSLVVATALLGLFPPIEGHWDGHITDCLDEDSTLVFHDGTLTLTMRSCADGHAETFDAGRYQRRQFNEFKFVNETGEARYRVWFGVFLRQYVQYDGDGIWHKTGYYAIRKARH